MSACGNALVLESTLPAPALLERLNTLHPQIYFTAAAAVDEGFRVRAASYRVYRYYDPILNPNLPVRRAAARLFRGRIDVRSFGRSVPGGEPQWRTFESVTVRSDRGGSTLELRAPSFVWGMVRKIVAAIRQVEAGQLDCGRLRDALAGRTRLMLPLAEPEPLILWDVAYDLDWSVRWRGPSKAQLRYRTTEAGVRRARDRVLAALEAE